MCDGAQLRLIADGERLLLHVVHYAAIGTCCSQSAGRLALETPNSNEVDRARFRSRLDQLIEYLPEEQRHLANGGGPPGGRPPNGGRPPQ
jgi:hypothetical protein